MHQKYKDDLTQANADEKKKIKDGQDAADQAQKDKLKKIKDDGKTKCKNHVSGSHEVVTPEEVPCYVEYVSHRNLVRVSINFIQFFSTLDSIRIQLSNKKLLT